MLTRCDAAHERMQEILARGEPLPFEFKNRIIYYVGPPTATRMDNSTEMMLAK
jgi:fumarate hydratase class I